ncbi:MAG: site-specific integrase [Nitrospinae bacterium]|nr:site-specific integrase [Nitrospinota bacterium]
MGVFKKQGVYWIDYYVNGHRKRERIGPDKRLAETVHHKRKVEIAEGKFLEKRKPLTTTFEELADAYLKWIGPDAKAGTPARKRAWKTGDGYAIGKLREYFGGKRLTAIAPALVEQYRTWRRTSLSRFGRQILPATVNRELAVLRHMFNMARKGVLVLKGGIPTDNPVSQVSLEREHNERERVLSAEEFQRVYEEATDWLKPMLLVAYHTGMRRGEILKLSWEHVDLRHGLIRLRARDTKTDEARLIPLHQILRDLLAGFPRSLGSPLVFRNPHSGEAYTPAAVSMAFQRACRHSGISNATFHDLRHTFVTNARRARIDYFRIMAITGHKTMRVFKHYHLIDEHDLRDAIAQMDTYMDTSAGEGLAMRRENVVNPRD